MKKGLIVFLVFAVVLVIGLWISAGVKANEINTKLTIDSANTSVVIKNSTGQQISNNSDLVLSATYTFVVTPNEGYELKVLTLNEEDILPNLVDNTYSFVCNGATTIKAASALISSGEIPDTPTEYLSFNYLGSIITQRNLFGLGGATTGVLNIYDNETTLLATLEAGQSYEYILPGNTYSVEFERLSGWGFAWLHSKLVDVGVFEPTAYKNGETFENVMHSLDFRVEYHGAYSATSYQPSVAAVGIVDINNNEVWNLTEGETYTINDITPDGYKVKLTQNGQELALPHTFVYSEDLMFELEVVETATISVTSNVEGYAIHYAFVDNLNERTLVDETTELIVGGDYVFYVTPPSGYYLTVWGGTFGLTSEDYIPSTSGRGGVIEPGAIEFDLTFNPAVTPTINGENFTTTFTNAYGEETNILVLGQRYTATFTPNEGYTIYSVAFNNSSLGKTQFHAFTVTESIVFDVYCFEICEPTIDFDIPNATYVIKKDTTDVTDSPPYDVGTKYLIKITPNEGYLIQDLFISGWCFNDSKYSKSWIGECFNYFSIELKAVQTKLMITGSTFNTFDTSAPTITPNLVFNGPDESVNYEELFSFEYHKQLENGEYTRYEVPNLVQDASYMFHFSTGGSCNYYKCDAIRIDGIAVSQEYFVTSISGTTSVNNMIFVAHEGLTIEFDISYTQNAYITPTITLSGYTGELSDVGSIKFRADTTSSNYITENLVVDTTYEATISTFSSSYYYISAVYVNGELVATNADPSAAMFTCQITATEDMEITLECTRK